MREIPPFKIPDQDDSQLITETHYYGWLTDTQPDNIHKLHTKLAYLKYLGFAVGEDFLDEVTLFRLKAIEQTYFLLNISPKICLN